MIRFIKKHQTCIFCLFNLLITFFSIVVLDADYIPQWMPGLSALMLTGIISKRKGIIKVMKRLRTNKDRILWDLVSLFIPIMSSLIVYQVICYIEPDEQFNIVFNNHTWQEYTLAVIFILIGSLGEEIGWRGFLLPNLLKKYSFTISSAIVGTVWGLWHFRFDSGVTSFLIYILFAIETSIIISWLYSKTKGSIISAIIYHTSINTCGLFLFENILLHTNLEYFQILFFGIYGLLLIVPCIFIVLNFNKRPLIKE